jgi:hypothetical protein
MAQARARAIERCTLLTRADDEFLPEEPAITCFEMFWVANYRLPDALMLLSEESDMCERNGFAVIGYLRVS